MFDVFKKLLMARQIQFEKGKLELLGQPVVFVPVQMFSHLIKHTKNSQKIANLIYTGCKLASEDFSKMMNKKYKFKTRRDFSKWLIDLFSLSGWGILTLEKLDFEGGEAIFHLKDSPVCKMYGRSDKPIDHAIRGLLAGGGHGILAKEVNAIETKCVSMGGTYCEFILKAQKRH
jgi:predicted hydrocarbon binding protein